MGKRRRNYILRAALVLKRGRGLVDSIMTVNWCCMNAFGTKRDREAGRVDRETRVILRLDTGVERQRVDDPIGETDVCREAFNTT